jgi:hypothetical protein
MDNNEISPFKELFLTEINSILEFSNSARNIQHASLKGNLREILFSNFLNKYLPNNYNVGRGIIIDHMGNQSSETDLLIYNAHEIPSFLYGFNKGLYPIECVKYVLEIKSLSNKNEIQTTINKFNKLKKLKSLNNSTPITVYYAYKTNLLKKNEFDRYIDNDIDFKFNPSINILAINDHGYWFQKNDYDNSGEKLVNILWQENRNNGNYPTLMLIVGILNTLFNSKVGYYLLDQGYFDITYIHFIELELIIKGEKAKYYKDYLTLKRKMKFRESIDFLKHAISDKEKFKKFINAVMHENRSENHNLVIYLKENYNNLFL